MKFDVRETTDGSSSSSQDNGSSAPLFGRLRSEPSHAYGYQGRQYSRQQSAGAALTAAADYYYMQNSDVTTNRVGMETTGDAERPPSSSSSACTAGVCPPNDGSSAAGYHGNDGYLTDVTAGDTKAPILGE